MKTVFYLACAAFCSTTLLAAPSISSIHGETFDASSVHQQAPDILYVKSFDEFVANKNPHTVFNALTSGEKPLIVKFFMTGCGPCKSTEPGYEALAKKYKDHALFITINVDKYDIGNKFKFSSVPTFMLFSKGKKIAQFKRSDFVGTINKELAKLGVSTNL